MNVIRFAIEATLLSAIVLLEMASVASAESIAFGRPVEDEATNTAIRRKIAQTHRKFHQKQQPRRRRTTHQKREEKHGAHRRLSDGEESNWPTYSPTPAPMEPVLETTLSITAPVETVLETRPTTKSPAENIIANTISSPTYIPTYWPTYSPTTSPMENLIKSDYSFLSMSMNMIDNTIIEPSMTRTSSPTYIPTDWPTYTPTVTVELTKRQRRKKGQ
mmetsp:Transcript_28175/g.67843  ORF Transcript_28175/g.67843 Transcript_28175/m.67843 type:complete len:218 (+) Transcript_28175:84-737(+)